MYSFAALKSDGTVRADLLDLLRLFWPDVPDGISLATVDALAQNWVIANQKVEGHPAQRWQGKPWPEFAKVNSTTVVDTLARLGFVDEMAEVSTKQFDYIIIPGGTVAPQRRRLALLARLWEQGVRTDNLIIMGGRPLDPKIDTLDKLVDNAPLTLPIRKDWWAPTALTGTETEMMREIWNQSVLPEGMDELSPLAIHATAQPGKNVGARDQVAVWFAEHNPQPGRVLIVTVQPHRFHEAMWQRLLPDGFIVECVAASTRPGRMDLPYLFDGLGRTIHEAAKAHA